MTKPIEASSSWKGLLGCLGGGLLFVILIVGVGFYVVGRLHKTEDRVQAEFLDPYVAALRKGEPEASWSNLTTESYRASNPLDVYKVNFALALERFGKPTSVVVTSTNSSYASGRSYQSVVTRWNWEKGPEFYRTFELIDVPDEGYRLDAGKLGGRNGQITPAEVPLGAW